MAVKKEIIRTGWREAWGILLVGMCALVLLSLISYRPEDISLVQSPPNSPALNFIGPVGAWIAFVILMGLGVVGYVVSAILGITGLLLIFKREGRVWPKVLWMLAILIAFLCLVELKDSAWAEWTRRFDIGGPGGALGALIAQDFFIRFLGAMGAGTVATVVLIAGIFFLIEVHPIILFRHAAVVAAALYKKFDAFLAERRDKREQIEHEQRELAKRRRRLEEVMKEQESAKQKEQRHKPAIGPAVIVKSGGIGRPVPEESIPPSSSPKRDRPKPVKAEQPEAASAMAISAAGQSRYQLPTMGLIDPLPPEKDREIRGDFQAGATILKETLSEFGVETDITNVERGPVVTRYELLPAPGVRVEKISALSNNIGLAMKAESVRIQAPIPGKGVVGIEVPNSKTTLVCLREVLESDAWRSGKAALPLVLGKDVGGRVIVTDLAEMPHLLIAGATGSGKTVCMNSILAGLLMSRTPGQMRLMLIDPKIVEFLTYNHLPHLVVPVITDPKKVAIGLRWAINEMEKRYKLFARVGVRNITAYNSRPIAKQAELFAGVEPEEERPEEQMPDRLPYIVIVVDELADLMLVAQADIENSIARLAQLSRAVGIHMILATQRPSVNVITGTIKANFPARISFQVAQKVDSRTILDANGADKLLGKGDLLFLPPGSSRLVRAQGTMTTDAELRRVVDCWTKQGVPNYEMAIKEKIESSSAMDMDDGVDDELLEAAIEIIRQTKRASTSSLQRRLRIGYTRAARLMDILESRGVVGPACGSDPREILIDLDGEIPQNKPDDLE